MGDVLLDFERIGHPNTLEISATTTCQLPASNTSYVVATSAVEGDYDDDVLEVYTNPTLEAASAASTRGG